MSEDFSSWQQSRREDSKGSSDGGTGTESWEFKSALEAPIARLESLDEIESGGGGGGGCDGGDGDGGGQSQVSLIKNRMI